MYKDLNNVFNQVKVSKNNVSISNQPITTSASPTIKNENTDSGSNINSGTEITWDGTEVLIMRESDILAKFK